ncbi:recombinase family protein [Bosea sp. OAE506]|uniref:recombinase family protein n=1 Tax=Bosea sp. OAE506 TaxID=2663870 RepID=UPI00178A378E
MNMYLRKMTYSPVSEDRPVRACGYFRVSTGRQAESDLSIPDQRNTILQFCAGKGWNLVAEYVEPGASATDDARPEFQKMIERATDDDRPFDIVLVHSFSRFFRDSFGLEMYIRKLAKAGVRLVSITQELGDDPAQVMMRQVIALFDEYQSRENAKHVLRAMKENARQGFYNGSPVPLGYTTAEVEKRGNRAKKKLVVDPVEAETVRQIFKLYRSGDGTGGPLGIKQVTCWLNERGYRTRKGARFGVATVHGILINTVYIGQWIFNKREAKTLTEKPASEHIVVEVPTIIPRDEFDAVQARMKVNAPMTTPPRVVTGPILLTGLAKCATCSGAMTLRTGTSKSGQVHRYYSCSVHGRMGKSACKGRAIRMDRLDTLVTDHLVDHLFQPDRLTVMLTGLAAGRAERALEVDTRITTLQTEASQAEDRLKRLYKMVEDGVTDLDDLLKERIAALKLERDRANVALERIKAQATPPTALEPEAIERFGRLMRENVTAGDIPFRKAYIQSVVDRVEVDDDIVRIIGDKATLEQAIAGSATRNLGVRSFERKWRARHDSNV